MPLLNSKNEPLPERSLSTDSSSAIDEGRTKTKCNFDDDDDDNDDDDWEVLVEDRQEDTKSAAPAEEEVTTDEEIVVVETVDGNDNDETVNQGDENSSNDKNESTQQQEEKEQNEQQEQEQQEEEFATTTTTLPPDVFVLKLPTAFDHPVFIGFLILLFFNRMFKLVAFIIVLAFVPIVQEWWALRRHQYSASSSSPTQQQYREKLLQVQTKITSTIHRIQQNVIRFFNDSKSKVADIYGHAKNSFCPSFSWSQISEKIKSIQNSCQAAFQKEENKTNGDNNNNDNDNHQDQQLNVDNNNNDIIDNNTSATTTATASNTANNDPMKKIWVFATIFAVYIVVFTIFFEIDEEVQTATATTSERFHLDPYRQQQKQQQPDQQQNQQKSPTQQTAKLRPWVREFSTSASSTISDSLTTFHEMISPLWHPDPLKEKVTVGQFNEALRELKQEMKSLHDNVSTMIQLQAMLLQKIEEEGKRDGDGKYAHSGDFKNGKKSSSVSAFDWFLGPLRAMKCSVKSTAQSIADGLGNCEI